MQVKMRKLSEQLNKPYARVPRAGGGPKHPMQTFSGTTFFACGSGFSMAASTGGTIFAGVSIYVDGITTPSNLELRDLIVKHGGDFQYYLVSSVTHIIATHLPDAKVKQLRYDHADRRTDAPAAHSI